MAYISLGNIGNMSNADVSDVVIARLPNNTFTNVRTFKESHYFSGKGNVVCRRIELTRTTVSCAFESVRCFFLSLFFPDKAQERYGKGTSNGDRLLEFILEGKGDGDEVEQAFINCKTVNLYVTEDCQYADIELLDSTMLIMAKISGQVGKVYMDNATIIGSIFSGCRIS